jgi:hypothetical protein
VAISETKAAVLAEFHLVPMRPGIFLDVVFLPSYSHCMPCSDGDLGSEASAPQFRGRRIFG